MHSYFRPIFLCVLIKWRHKNIFNFFAFRERARAHARARFTSGQGLGHGHTIRSWIETLCSLYYCYELRPWSKNIARALIKEPKYFLWDWAQVSDMGARAENFVASHLLKAVHFWTDAGFGRYDLYYIRDKDQREVDFLVTHQDEPWFLVEVKMSDNKGIAPALSYFQKATGAKHAFQVVLDLPWVNRNCFEENRPVIVPARTFLSQLV